MRGSLPRPLGGALCFLFLLYGYGAAAAQEPPLQAFRRGEALAFVPLGDSARIELPDGRTLRLALPRGTLVSSFGALDGGWIAAGSVPEESGGRRLFLLKGDETGARPLPLPAGQQGLERRRPVLLIDGGRLAGMAWLEGDGPTALCVRAAAWTGRRWQAPQRVSHPGPGSQVGLAGAVLDDGSWLLAWSAFDGTADEIVWSRRAGREWLPAQRVSRRNAVPDITPSVAAIPGGALIAWSRYDGRGYQMRLARFDGGGWRDERAAGPSGSLYPVFLGEAGQPRLLYLDVSAPGAGRAWSVLDLDPAGSAKGRATIPSPLERPLVAFAGDEVRMRWPGHGEVAAARLERLP